MSVKDRDGKKDTLEKQLWKSADKLRKNIDAVEYKHFVLGLIFLKYISDAFEELFETLKAGEGEFAGADPEDKDEYKAENVFFVPSDALAEGKKGGQFYTPRSVVELLIEMLEPYKGRVFSSSPNGRSWDEGLGEYQDIKGFCNAASIERVKELDYVLTPG